MTEETTPPLPVFESTSEIVSLTFHPPTPSEGGVRFSLLLLRSPPLILFLANFLSRSLFFLYLFPYLYALILLSSRAPLVLRFIPLSSSFSTISPLSAIYDFFHFFFRIRSWRRSFFEIFLLYSPLFSNAPPFCYFWTDSHILLRMTFLLPDPALSCDVTEFLLGLRFRIGTTPRSPILSPSTSLGTLGLRQRTTQQTISSCILLP